MGYKGSEGYLSEAQKQEVVDFLKLQQSCSLETLTSYLEEKFDIIYKSKQSYYDLFDLAGMSWKKTEKINPKKDEQKVLEKQEDIKKTSVQKRRNTFRGTGRFDRR